jgi:hypothetical protein
MNDCIEGVGSIAGTVDKSAATEVEYDGVSG